MFVKKENAISEIKNATNAVQLEGFPVDKVMFVGPGAGEFPTASSVVGDILAIKSDLNQNKDKVLPITICHHKEYANQIDIKETTNCYYLRIEAKNKLGIIGKIGCACGEFGINLSSIVQRGTNENNATILVLTEKAKEDNILNMINSLEETQDIKVVNKIRVM